MSLELPQQGCYRLFYATSEQPGEVTVSIDDGATFATPTPVTGGFEVVMAGPGYAAVKGVDDPVPDLTAARALTDVRLLTLMRYDDRVIPAYSAGAVWFY